MGILFLRRGKMLNGAMWFGKVCTALIFAALLIFVTVTDMSDFFVNLFCGDVCACIYENEAGTDELRSFLIIK